MKWKKKRHPRRKVDITEVRLRGYEAVTMNLYYHTETKSSYTSHEQPIEMSLCEVRYLAGMIHEKVIEQLQAQLDEFRNTARGE